MDEETALILLFCHTDTSSTHSIEYLSSSEEGLAASFLEARRSKKYMSKRTSGTFRDYLRSRSTDPGAVAATSPLIRRLSDVSGNAGAGSISGHYRKHSMSSTRSAASAANGVSASAATSSASPTSGDDSRNGILKSAKSVRRAQSLHNSATSSSYSAYINDVHGLRSSPAVPMQLPPIEATNDVSASVDASTFVEPPQSVSSSASSQHIDDADGADAEAEADDEVFELRDVTSSVNCRPSIIGGRFDRQTDDDGGVRPTSRGSFGDSNGGGGGGGGGFESTDDWYASVSDMEDSDNGPSKPYAYNAVNPVLECVNQVGYRIGIESSSKRILTSQSLFQQILLQQSMDCTLESSSPPPSSSPSSSTRSHHHSHPDAALPSTPSNSPSYISRYASNQNSCSDSAPSSIQPLKTNTNQAPAKCQKRVHFSTQNSMVQVPRADSIHYIDPHHYQPQPQPADNNNVQQQSHQHVPANGQHNHQHQFSYESVYSNEYEPVGSEHDSIATTNHYVDMDSKLSVIDEVHYITTTRPMPVTVKTNSASSTHNNQTSKPSSLSSASSVGQMPPALPPKPSNLMKIRNVPRPTDKTPTQSNATNNHRVDGQQPNDDIDTGSHSEHTDTEPDYASILEIGPVSITPPKTLKAGEATKSSVQQSNRDMLPQQQHQIARHQELVLVDVHKSAAPSDDHQVPASNPDQQPIQMVGTIPPPTSTDVFRGEQRFSADDRLSLGSSDSSTADDEAFADVPKLPNVAAIISPKKDIIVTSDNPKPAVITQDNYITRSPPMIIAKMPAGILSKSRADRSAAVKFTNGSKVVAKSAAIGGLKLSSEVHLPAAVIYEDKMRMQAEFDWYNLDVEYSGLQRSRKPSSGMGSSRDSNRNHGLAGDEYNDDDDDGDEDDDDEGVDSAENDGGNRNHVGNEEAEREPNYQTFGVEYKLDEEYTTSSVYPNGVDHYAYKLMDATDGDMVTDDTADGSVSTVGPTTTTTATSVSRRSRRLYSAHGTIHEDDRDECDDEAYDEEIVPAKRATPTMATKSSIGRHPRNSIGDADASDSFETFLCETGLASKPLPRKRRIFY